MQMTRGGRREQKHKRLRQRKLTSSNSASAMVRRRGQWIECARLEGSEEIGNLILWQPESSVATKEWKLRRESTMEKRRSDAI